MRSKISITIALSAIVLTMSMSCNGITTKGGIQDTIAIMKNHRLKLSLNHMARCTPDNDTARTDTAATPFRLVVYVDSTNCSPCVLNKMYKWNPFIDNTRAKGNRVGYVFIFEPKAEQIEDAHFAVESSGLKNRVYLDTAHVFRKENMFMPKDSKYHTLLIDNRDSILLVGNPKSNNKIEEFFLKIINK